jgi:cytochrome c oxidase subunit 4
VPLGAGNSLVNLAIAAAKAALIAAAFMHLRRSGVLVSLCVVVLLFWIGMMYGLTFNDYVTR